MPLTSIFSIPVSTNSAIRLGRVSFLQGGLCFSGCLYTCDDTNSTGLTQWVIKRGHGSQAKRGAGEEMGVDITKHTEYVYEFLRDCEEKH